MKRKIAVGVLSIGFVLLGGQNVVLGDEGGLYADYNKEREDKLELESKVKEYELNAILLVSDVADWDLFSDSSKPKGTYSSLDDLYKILGEDLNSHKSYYEDYKENETKPIEEQKELEAPSNLDYLSVSDIEISYYYDAVQEQLSQLIRIRGVDNVFRCTIIYNKEGKVVNYLEA